MRSASTLPLLLLLSPFACTSNGSAPDAEPDEKTAAASGPAKPDGPAKPSDAATDSQEDREIVELAESLQGDVEELRGLKFVRPVKKGVYDKERLAKFLEQKLAEEEGEQDLRSQQTALRLFGLIPEEFDIKKEMTDVLMEQIGGFYDPDTRELYVMRGFTGFMGKILMAHELCHALDDQHFDLKTVDDRLEKEWPDDDDRVFASHAVIEGCATELMVRYSMREALRNPGVLQDMDLSNPALRGDKAMAAPPIIVRPLLEMYHTGASFLARGGGMMQRAKRKDVNHAFKNLPVSSEQVLHPEKYWEESKRDEPRSIELPDLAPVLGAGWKREGTNVLGELGTAILTSPPEEAELPKAELEGENPEGGDKGAAAAMELARKVMERMGKSTPEAEGWDGDRYAVFSGPGGASLLVWASVWDSAGDAKELLEALGGPRLAAKAMTGSTVVAVFESAPKERRSSAPAVLDAVLNGMKVSPETQAPKPVEER